MSKDTEDFTTVLDRAVRFVFVNEGISPAQLCLVAGIGLATLGRWMTGTTIPREAHFARLLAALVRFLSSEELDALRTAYRRAGGGRRREPPPAPHRIEAAAVRQIPAAFRFGVRGAKIDARPENLETLDRPLAEDIYDELKTKLAALQQRLARAGNVDPHLAAAVARFAAGLGAGFADVRAGIVLMRFHSIEAIVAGFDTEEGRAALFPDAIAMLVDLQLSGQDFLAALPNARRIERQRLATGLEKTPEAVAAALAETDLIAAAAGRSDIVAPGAVAALTENTPDIAAAPTAEVKADLAADRLLIHRNFMGAALRAIARKSGDAWEIVGPDFTIGAKHAARLLPSAAVIALLTAVAGPVAGLAALLKSDIFKPVRGAVATTIGATARRKSPKRPAAAEPKSTTVLGEAMEINNTIKQLARKYGLSPRELQEILMTRAIPGTAHTALRHRGLLDAFVADITRLSLRFPDMVRTGALI